MSDQGANFILQFLASFDRFLSLNVLHPICPRGRSTVL
jgi:hypothetical protein